MIIHRSFIREVLQASGAVAAILLSIFLVVRVMSFLRQAAEGDLPVGGVALLLLLKMVTYLDIMIPFVVYVAILLVMGRWSRDNELVAIGACGMGVRQLLRPASWLFLGVGSMVALISLYLAPLSVEMSITKGREYQNRTDVSGILPGVFNDTRGGQGVIFVERYDRESDTFHEIFVYHPVRGEEQIVVAHQGVRTVDEESGSEFLVLEEGAQYRGRTGTAHYGVLNFDTYRLRLKKPPRADSPLPLAAQSTLDLWEGKDPEAMAQLHWRLSKVGMLPTLILFALAFSSPQIRRVHFPPIVLALLVYFAYFNCLGFTMALIERGSVSPWPGLWTVHGLFVVVAVWLFQRRNRNHPLLSQVA